MLKVDVCLLMGTLTIDETSKIKRHIHEGIMRSSQLRKNDVLIAIVGATIGKVALYNEDRMANINLEEIGEIGIPALSKEQQQKYVYGYASMPANNWIKYDETHIVQILKRIFNNEERIYYLFYPVSLHQTGEK